MSELETIDLEGIEVMSTGGPVRAIGSPPEGDHYTTEDLQRIAQANVELADEVRAANKLGHSRGQRLLRASGLTEGEMPAIGWLDGRSFRVSEDGTKLLADARKVPKKIGQLLRAGAYRTRSAELSRVTSQRTGKTHDWVVTGLAWLGGKMPAIQTLDDVVRLYEAEEGEEVERVALVEHEGADAGGEAALEAMREIVRDHAAAVIDELRERPADDSRPASDTRPMSEITLNEDQARTLAEKLGVDGDLDFDTITGKLDELSQRATGEPQRDNAAEERIRDLEAKAEAGQRAEQRLFEMQRDSDIDAAVKDGRIEPAKRADYVRRYNEHPDLMREVIADLKPDTSLEREFGADDGHDGSDPALDDDAYKRHFEQTFGTQVPS